MRPANGQEGFDRGHDFKGHRKYVGISALGQISGTERAWDWNKM